MLTQPVQPLRVRPGSAGLRRSCGRREKADHVSRVHGVDPEPVADVVELDDLAGVPHVAEAPEYVYGLELGTVEGLLFDERPSDRELLMPAVEAHRRVFGRVPIMLV